ncbi:hypothetical protein BDY24DRAFT_415847 [Mrakia frigida]|uniref:uncharacterized protein n=1 Tax=Mrakia frigida TaxID=29902 RepID=UPI003FCBF5EA
MVLLCSNCHSSPATTCSNCIDKNILSPYDRSLTDQVASHKRHARKAVSILDGEGGLEQVRLLESQIAEMEAKVEELLLAPLSSLCSVGIAQPPSSSQSLINHHLQTLPIRQSNLLQHPFQPTSSSFVAPPPSNQPSLWAIRQKRMLELLDVFDVRPADEEEGEEDEDWVIGGGLVVPGRREELDVFPPDQTSSALIHTLHLLKHLSSLASCSLPNPPQIHPPALLPPPFLTSSTPSTHSHTHSSPSSSSPNPTTHLFPSPSSNLPTRTLLTSLAHLQADISHFSSFLGIPIPASESSRVLANIVRAIEDGTGEPVRLGASLEEFLDILGVGETSGDGGKAEGGKGGKREGETKEERRERRERREEKRAKAKGEKREKSERGGEVKEGVEEWEVVDGVI